MSGFLILFINDLIIPGLPTIAGGFELFFVNSMNLPFGSGAAFFTLLIIIGLVWGIRYTRRTAKHIWNTLLLSSAFILIGYASYAIIVIRSNYDTPIDENDPSDVMSFVSYLKREQYGSRPLLYGQYFTARLIDIKEGAMNTGREKINMRFPTTSVNLFTNQISKLLSRGFTVPIPLR